MKKWLVGWACVGMLAATVAHGALNIADGTDVTQNFDSIGATATATLPTDWKTDKQTTARTVGTFAAAVTATERVDGQNVSTTAGNGIYNLGAPTDDATDRAIGWLSSSSATKSGNLYVEMVNSGATAITNLFISYNVEKYRNGANTAGFQVQLYYSTDGSNWTSAGATFLTTFPADADNAGYATPPGTTAAVSGNLDLSAAPIAASANVYLAWSYSVQSGTTTSSAQLLGMDDVSIALAGVSTPSISFSAASAATDEPGSHAVVINKNMASGDVSGEIVLSGTATEGAGADYTVDTTNFTLNGTTTSATINVTINDDADVEPAETVVLALANMVGANLLVPNVFTLTINASDIPTHAITIVTNAPENGTVTTTPAGTAEEGATVTIVSTPAAGYRVARIAVVDGASNPVTVTGNTFVMPTSDATVTVTFEVAPDFSLNFADMPTLYYSNTTTTANGLALDIDQCYRDVNDADYMIRTRWTSTNAGYFNNAVAFTNGSISKMVFRYKAYSGANTNYQFVVQFKTSGGDWTQVGDTYLANSTNWMTGEVTNPPAGATYFRMQTVPPASGTDAKTGNFDDIGFWFGAAIFGVTFDQVDGFVIEEGTTDVIVATAANGTEPYAYSWTSTLGEGYRTADSNQFTILASAPVGDYSATVVATDGTTASVTNTINFSVKAPHAIAITPPTNGTVTTTPADAAIAGTTVTITATPAANYLVGSIVVLDDTATPVAVVGNDFVMPDAPVTVTVTFVYDVATLPISEVYTNTADWTLLPGWSGVGMGSYTDGDAQFGSSNDALTVNFDAQPGTLSFDLQGRTSAAGTAPAQFLVEESADGSSWTQVVSINDTQLSTTNAAFGPYSLLAVSRYVRWIYVNKYAYNIGLNNVSITSGGAPVFSVSFDKTNGFTVANGASDAITATAANGTEPYGYSWTSTLGEGYRTAVDNVFTILATAPAGDYTATVTATDNAAQTASNVVSFTVLGGGAAEWQIGDGADGGAMFYTTSNRNVVIVLPTNYNLTAVYGTDSSAVGLNNLGQGTGSPLTENVDYTWTPATRTVNVLCGVTNRRVLRIGASAP